jgi:hypothetical protein
LYGPFVGCQALLANIRLGWKGWQGTSTSAYRAPLQVTKNGIMLYFEVIYGKMWKSIIQKILTKAYASILVTYNIKVLCD